MRGEERCAARRLSAAVEREAHTRLKTDRPEQVLVRRKQTDRGETDTTRDRAGAVRVRVPGVRRAVGLEASEVVVGSRVRRARFVGGDHREVERALDADQVLLVRTARAFASAARALALLARAAVLAVCIGFALRRFAGAA